MKIFNAARNDYGNIRIEGKSYSSLVIMKPGANEIGEILDLSPYSGDYKDSKGNTITIDSKRVMYNW